MYVFVHVSIYIEQRHTAVNIVIFKMYAICVFNTYWNVLLNKSFTKIIWLSFQLLMFLPWHFSLVAHISVIGAINCFSHPRDATVFIILYLFTAYANKHTLLFTVRNYLTEIENGWNNAAPYVLGGSKIGNVSGLSRTTYL